MSDQYVPLTPGVWEDQRGALDVAVTMLEALVPVHSRPQAYGTLTPAMVSTTAAGAVRFALPTPETAPTVLDPRYASPEVMASQPVMPSDDCYSVGAILYELLAGAPPPRSTGTSPVPELLDMRPGINPQLSAVVMKAVADDPDLRYQRAGEMINDLQAIRPMVPGPFVEAAPTVITPIAAPPSRVGPIIAMIAVAALILGALAYFLLRSDDDVVPATANQPVAIAQQALVDAGFRPTIAQEPSDSVAKGRAIRTDPAAGTRAPSGSTVLLIVSGAAESKAIPSVVGQEQSAAAATLTRLGFKSSFTRQADPSPAGVVVDQSPPAGTNAPPGTAVVLAVSSGPPPVRTETVTTPATPQPTPTPTPPAATVQVPSVIGQSLELATRTITGAGLAVGTITRSQTDTQPAGTVINQNPAPGTTVNPKTQVALLIAEAPATP